MLVDELAALDLFAGVSREQLQRLVSASEEVSYEAGEVLWSAGAPSDYWWVNLEGTLDMVRMAGSEEIVVGQFSEPGRWAGGFGVWDENAAYFATGRANSHGRLLKVPVAALRALVADLPLVTHLAEGMFRTVRNIEASARQRDALLTLGTLSAGLAHEINNPAAAATRAVDSLEGAMADALQALDGLAGGQITAEQFTALGELRREAIEAPVIVDPIALVDLEDELSSWLGARGVDRDWILAPALAARGLRGEWCARVEDVVQGPALSAAFEWIASTLTVASLLGEVKESTRRISELVAAVKSYSQMDRGALQRVDLTEGLESTLVMLGHKLRDGIVVVRDFAENVPQVEVYPGELNQVWTNLIDNAIDAMDGSGTLTITTRLEGDDVEVGISDSGPGMPPEVAARAFETFFTTKDVGAGTGLGLDIARRIVVERHGGRIHLHPSPTGTTAHVTLPVTQR